MGRPNADDTDDTRERVEGGTRDASERDHDVVIVGGGPAGCSAGVFTARYGLDTVIFDRGNSSIRRCAYLENHLGFPAGIDTGTYCELAHDHARHAGCSVIADMVASITRSPTGFRVETHDENSVETSQVIAATKYDAEYLRGLDGTAAMFEAGGGDNDDENTTEEFDPDAADRDGHAPVEGLYVAGPLAGVGDQAIIAAGHGAQVARTLIEDRRRAVGHWDAIAKSYDWVRNEAERSGEWEDRERWLTYFEAHLTPENHDRSDAEFEWLRERYIDDRFEQYVTRETVEERTERGAQAILEHIDDEYIRAYLHDAETPTAHDG